MDEADELQLVFDPDYQNNLFLIESALQEVSAMDAPADVLPDVFDEQLRMLIDAVSLG